MLATNIVVMRKLEQARYAVMMNEVENYLRKMNVTHQYILIVLILESCDLIIIILVWVNKMNYLINRVKLFLQKGIVTRNHWL
jgi:hypothetical protein